MPVWKGERGEAVLPSMVFSDTRHRPINFVIRLQPVTDFKVVYHGLGATTKFEEDRDHLPTDQVGLREGVVMAYVLLKHALYVAVACSMY